KSSEKATLTARMIDRPIRPLFPKGWHYETQLVAMPLSVDHVNPYDILAMNGASAALAISEVPVAKHVGAVRVGKLEGDFVVNPPEERHEELELDLIVAGTDEAILMVEAGANGVSEAEILDALDIAHGEIKKLVAAMAELQEKAGKEKIQHEEPELDSGLLDQIRSEYGQALVDAIATEGKLERYEAIDKVKDEVVAKYAPENDDAERVAEVKAAFGAIEKDTIRKAIAVDKKRPDGRAQDEIRPIECEVDISPRVHGSALFTRGETQILSNVALGTTRMDMRLDTLGLQTTKRFFHHYNFPPFSVGEAGFMRGPKRRDIGHGALAERALVATIPDEESFPYVIRAVSETLESNGSSSMGSVCASSMALQAAGVPVTAPVAGVAMGLIKEGDDYIVLTDIAGVEDHLGDMDFKVAGTKDGITALQMDIKITGVTFEILEDALEQALKGRQFILGKMAEAIDGPREKLSKHAPAIESIKIDPEKIGAVIGKGGETIRALCEEFEAEIDVEDDGTVRIYAPTGELVDACVARIDSMTREAEVGDRYNSAKVVKTTTFGAFVELVKGTDGLLHISNVKPGERVDSVDDVLTAGEEIDVTVVEVDKERGRIGLRLSDDPSVAGKSPEELASVGSGDGGPRRNGGDRGGREGRPRRDRERRS
ncbi:MAG TPA: polyribonucleotide nucleotidyltransferase, partial [Solirubrobacterales bacterium]